jgi:DNA-binding CsgD family transcriptional regulator
MSVNRQAARNFAFGDGAQALEHPLQRGPAAAVVVAQDPIVLRSLVGRFIAEMGADGAVLLQRGADRPTTILFADLCCAATDSRTEEEASALAGAVGRDADLAGGGERWRQCEVAGKTFTVLGLTFPQRDRTCFELRVICRGPEAKPRRSERVVRMMRAFLAEVLTLWNDGERLRQHADGLTSALDRSDIGIVLLDVKGELLFTNRTADGLIEAGNGVRTSGRAIAADNLSDSLRLKVAIDHVLTDRARGIGQPRTPLVSLRRSGKHRPLFVSVMSPDLPLDSNVAVILFLFDPDRDLRPLVGTACAFYALSPVEIILTCLLVGGASLCEAATTMRVKEQTARSYLKQIFLKTDTNRQADLVRLMLSSIVRTAGPANMEVV